MSIKPYVPDFQYLLFEASKENEDQYITSVVIRCWLIIVKYLNDPAMREKLSEVLRLLHNFLENREAREYIEIFMKHEVSGKHEQQGHKGRGCKRSRRNFSRKEC